MYSFYIWSFQYLAAHEVALLTATTPLFVILIGSFREKFWSGMFFLGALFAVIGAAVIAIRPGEISVTMTGVALVQAANLCFAIGQLFYKKIKLTENFLDHTVFGWAFLGACIVPLFITYARGWQTIVWPHDTTQWMTILYLGIVPSGLGFFLWNKGVSEVNIGQASVMNNLKIPLAVGFSWLLFGENVSWLRLLTGALLIVFGLWLVKLEKKKQLSIFV
jgi:drug/metabolite transporter (DMT)-like permease